jgi:BirA family biotin operon repressor/biotin-[acetyl-CoA-carboxylase] ligase
VVIDSTNRVAERLAAQGAPEGTLVVADRQTAGRGRLGRSFASPPGGGLYLSLLLRPPCPIERLHEHVFAAAVAVADAVQARLPALDVQIKWPNDVLLSGRKTSGINLPTQLDGDRAVSAVLGVGVNVNTGLDDFPDEVRPIATSLRLASGEPQDRLGFASDLLGRLERGIDRLRDEGFGPVLDCWRRYFRMEGARVRVGGPGVPREFEGTVTGVDPDGALVLEALGRRERVLAGDVTLLGSTTRSLEG